MANPQIAQGTLNRARGAVVVADSPELNVTAPYLGREGISSNFEGDTTARMPTLTGIVNSPEIFMAVTVTICLLKTQALSDTYKQRMETNAIIGDITVIPDSPALSNYVFQNCSIRNVHDLALNGTTPNFMVTLQGFYPVNASLFD